jgi:general L-amino acid transport system substrate-binding protein
MPGCASILEGVGSKEGVMRRSIFARVLALTSVVTVIAAGCTRGGDGDGDDGDGDAQARQSLLQVVQDRGTLRCGVNATVPGFGFETGEGVIEGFDIDFCKAIAAAVFGTAEVDDLIELVPVDADQRFSQLRAGRYDVLVRNTTWTSSRDGTEGIAFAHPNFYDAQGMMVREGEFGSIEEMDGVTVCVTAGTTTELNLADYFQTLNLDFSPLVLEDNDQILEAFRAERCDGWTSDLSQLAGLRSQFEEELGALEIFDDVMSKEPLAPGVIDGDSDWYDVVNWVVNGLILAEEIGVTSENVAQEAENPSSPAIASLLGVSFQGDPDVNFEHGLSIEDTFMQDVVAAVGNYGEIFDRNVGPDSPLELERGLNALWTDGGLQYGMPFR